jgi:hypothetical protein
MLESSAPSVPVSDYQLDVTFDLSSYFIIRRAEGDAPIFEQPAFKRSGRELILNIIERASREHKTDRKAIRDWISDVALYSPGVIFTAGPLIRSESSVHLIAVSLSENMMRRMQRKLTSKPPGVWAYYLTLAKTASGIESTNMLSIPQWLRGIMSSAHVFFTTDPSAYDIIRRLRIESVHQTRAAPEMILSELAILDVYRKHAKRMPTDSSLASLALRSELEGMGFSKCDLLAECDTALRARLVKNEPRKKAIKQIASYIGIGPEELSKYHSNIVLLRKVKKKTPSSLPFNRIRKGSGKQIV